MHSGCHVEQVYLCREPIDFRKSINVLSILVEQENRWGHTFAVTAI